MSIINIMTSEIKHAYIDTAAARTTWESHITDLLPAVPSDSVKVLTSTNGYASNCKVLITSYTLMDKNVEILLKKSFGCIILVSAPTFQQAFQLKFL